MAQTVGRRTRGIAADVWGSYDVNDLLVIDEAHHAAAEGVGDGHSPMAGQGLGYDCHSVAAVLGRKALTTCSAI